MVIEAAPGKVWEMLTNSKYVAQWDELPEHDPEESMTGGEAKSFGGIQTADKLLQHLIRPKRIKNELLICILRHGKQNRMKGRWPIGTGWKTWTAVPYC